MTDRGDNPLGGRLAYGTAGLVAPSKGSIASRKGTLLLLASPDAVPEALEAIRHEYATDVSYDADTSLGKALAQAHDRWESTVDSIPAGVVLQGNQVVLVAPLSTTAWIARFQSVQNALDPQAGRGRRLAIGERGSWQEDYGLYTARWRLGGGDLLVVGAPDVALRVSPGAAARILARPKTLTALAQQLSSAATAKNEPAPPILVVRAEGFAPVPGVRRDPYAAESVRPVDTASPPRPRARASIWIAIVFAIAALGATYILNRPSLDLDQMREYVEVLFLPESTPTVDVTTPTPEPSPTPSFDLPPVSLSSPPTESTITRNPVELSWDWEDQLPTGSEFEVRVWRAGRNPEKAALVTETTAKVSLAKSGWYEWTVVVVQAREGRSAEALTSVPEPQSFFWQGN